MSEYNEILSKPSFDQEKRAVIGPFPRITDIVGLQEFASVEVSGSLSNNGTTLLEFIGEEETMIMPSLDVTALLAKLQTDKLEKITYIVGVNSDSYNRGLGVTLKATHNTTDNGSDVASSGNREDWYEYGGGKTLDSASNSIKFHPDMRDGQLRVEGPGGFHNQDIGFTPLGWSASTNELTILEITISADGANEILVKGASTQDTWKRAWKNVLIHGNHIPALFAHIDLGGVEGKPLIIGPMSELSAARAARKKAAAVGRDGDIRLADEENDQDEATDSKAEGASTTGGKPKEQESYKWTSRAVKEMDADMAQAIGYPQVGTEVTKRQMSWLLDVQGLQLEDLIENGWFVAKSAGKPALQKEETPGNGNTTILRNIPIADLITLRGRGSKHVNGSKVHPALVASSAVFWAMMVLLPWLLKETVTCDGAPPALATNLFLAHTALDLFLQVWIMIQTRHGFIITTMMPSKFLYGVGLTCMCRFDTFGDVLNTAKLFHCEPITWFSIKGWVFHIPFHMELSHIALATLVVGVLCAQALPGLVLLCRKSYLPIALKLNEFNLLLVVMMSEKDELDGVGLEKQDSDGEQRSLQRGAAPEETLSKNDNSSLQPLLGP
jgi:hypothetical protein